MYLTNNMEIPVVSKESPIKRIPYLGYQQHDKWCYLMENPDKIDSDWYNMSIDERKEYHKRPVRIEGEGTPGKFYFCITNPTYQLVEITPSNAKHHYLMCFESI